MADSSIFGDAAGGAAGALGNGSLFSALGISGATGIMGGLGLAGLGVSLLGGFEAAAQAKHVAQDQSAIAGLQIQENSQRRLAMNLNTQRTNLQNLRNMQQGRSMALAAATSSGSQFSTGLQGAYGNISGQGTNNQLATNQNTQIGNSLFDLDNQISVYKADIARAQGDEATDQGLAAVGKGLMGASGPLGKIFG